jgi:predicted amidohydrolase
MCSKPGDVEGNIQQIEEFAKKAKANDCHVLLSPELSISGYGGYEEVLSTAEVAGEGIIYKLLSRIARENNIVMLAGFVEQQETKKHLSHYIIYPDGAFFVQRKHRVTPLEAPLEPYVELYFDDSEEIGHVKPGQEKFTYFMINGVKCVVVICADAGIKGLHDIFDQNQVDVVFLPVGAGGKREDKVTNEELRTEEGISKYYRLCNNEYFFPGGSVLDCIKHDRCIAAVNMCGFDGKKLYHGGSGSIVNHFGEIVGHLAGIENIDRQRPMFVCGEVDFNERLVKDQGVK